MTRVLSGFQVNNLMMFKLFNVIILSFLGLISSLSANAAILEVILDKQLYAQGDFAKITAVVKPKSVSTDFEFHIKGSLVSNGLSNEIKFKKFNNIFLASTSELVAGANVSNVLTLNLFLSNSKKIKELNLLLSIIQAEVTELETSPYSNTDEVISRINVLKHKSHIYHEEIKRQSTLVETLEIVIPVERVNSIPEAVLKATPASGESPLEVFFDASESNDAEGPIAEYCLDFGDNVRNCQLSPLFNHNYGIPGVYTARLRVEDDEGVWSEWDETTIEVKEHVNLPPVVGDNQNLQSIEDNIFTFSLNVANDPEGQPLTYRMTVPPESGTILGCLNNTGSTSCSFTPAEDFNGSVQIKYRAFDGELQSVSEGIISIDITPINDPPIPGEDQEVETASGNPLDFAINEATDIDTATEDLIYQIETAPQYGSLSGCIEQNSDLTCTYTPAPGFVGEDSFVYTVLDGSGSEGSEGLIRIIVNPASGTPIKQIALSGGTSCILYETGKVNCWGWNSQGQLGLGHINTIGLNESPAEEVTRVDIDEEIVQLASGVSHTCALLADGNVRCWGQNFRGQLGLGHTNSLGDNELPSEVAPINLGGGRKAKFVAAGFMHTCVILTSGIVKCWGFNHVGQLGIGNTEDIGDNESPSTSPDVNLGEEAVALAAGHSFTCAILVSGNVKCWGHNYSGVIGLGRLDTIGDNESASNSPLIDLGTKAVSISAGYDHVCALLDDGHVKCWGDNQKGQLGYRHLMNMGDTETLENLPSINIGARSISITTGERHTCALLETREMKCWGDNSWGQLGQGHNEVLGDNEHPFEIPAVSFEGSVSNINSGSMNSHACAFLNNGFLRCWGMNQFGQLGLGFPIDKVGDDELPTDVLPVQHE